MKKISFKFKNSKNQKKKVLGILAALMMILSLAGTFAWQAYTDWVKNHMQSLGFDNGDVTIVEDFDKDKPIDGEGGTIKKKVDVINSTPVEAFVRISFEEQIDKLAAGASDSKAFSDRNATGFPVVTDAKAYYLAGSPWKNETAKLKVDGAQAPAGLELFVNGKESVLVYERDIAKADFPANFKFKDTKFELPIRPAKIGETVEDHKKAQAIAIDKLAAGSGSVPVAQKVSGHVKRNVQTDTYEVTTTNADAKLNLGYWGYSTAVANKLTEWDWAGKNTWVDATYQKNQQPDFTATTVKSKMLTDGPTINFSAANIVVGSGLSHSFTDADKGKWFYNTDDGYFYLLSPLNSGTQTSASVMDSITFPKNPTYNLAAYDLHVGSESIPAQRSMLSAASNYGEVSDQTDKDTYNLTGKITLSNGSGFGLTEAKDKDLLKFLANQSTIEDTK